MMPAEFEMETRPKSCMFLHHFIWRPASGGGLAGRCKFCGEERWMSHSELGSILTRLLRGAGMWVERTVA